MFSLNRGSGGILGDTTPLEFMLCDRNNLLELCDILAAAPELVSKVSGFSVDYATYDYIQCGKALEFNYLKGIVHKPDEYLTLIRSKF